MWEALKELRMQWIVTNCYYLCCANLGLHFHGIPESEDDMR